MSATPLALSSTRGALTLTLARSASRLSPAMREMEASKATSATMDRNAAGTAPQAKARASSQTGSFSYRSSHHRKST